MSRRALPVATDRREGVRGALLHTLPGRAIVIGLGVKIVVAAIGAASGGVSPFLSIVDSVATIAAAVGIAVFAFRLIVLAKRRLLWRVRRKLILSYVFIGFVPALLLVAFSLLCGFLLFYSFSGYLVQSRLSALSERAGYIAQSTAIEIQRSSGRDARETCATSGRTRAATRPSRKKERRRARTAARRPPQTTRQAPPRAPPARPQSGRKQRWGRAGGGTGHSTFYGGVMRGAGGV